MIPAELLNDCLELARKVAPVELERPLYLLDSLDLAGQRNEPRDVYAYTSTSLVGDLGVRDWLVANGQWQGPGRAIVFDLEKITQDCSDKRRAVLETLLHELAHCLPITPATVDRKPSPMGRYVDATVHAAFVAAPSRPTIDSDHGGPFVRRCVHLWHRALWAGFHAPVWTLGGGSLYGMSHALAYVEALADEPLRLRGETFGTIEATPPPTAFNALWDADKQHLLEQK